MNPDSQNLHSRFENLSFDRELLMLWGGKVVAGKGGVEVNDLYRDWVGHRIEHGDGFRGVGQKLVRLATNIVTSEVISPSHTLPITWTTQSFINKNEILPTASVELSELLIGDNRIAAIQATSSTALKIGVLNLDILKPQLVGSDLFSPIRKPRIYVNDQIPRRLAPYTSGFDVRVAGKSDSDNNYSQLEKIKLPYNWGIWNHPEVESFLPLLSIIATLGLKTIKQNAVIGIIDGFGNDPCNPINGYLKLDFIRALQDITMRWYHFSTNPIVPKNESGNNISLDNLSGIAFIDKDFFDMDLYLGTKPIVQTGISMAGAHLGANGSKSRQVLGILSQFILEQKKTGFQDNPNLQLLKLASTVGQIIN